MKVVIVEVWKYGNNIKILVRKKGEEKNEGTL